MAGIYHGTLTGILLGDHFQGAVASGRAEQRNRGGRDQHAAGDEGEDAAGAEALEEERDHEGAEHGGKPAPGIDESHRLEDIEEDQHYRAGQIGSLPDLGEATGWRRQFRPRYRGQGACGFGLYAFLQVAKDKIRFRGAAMARQPAWTLRHPKPDPP